VIFIAYPLKGGYGRAGIGFPVVLRPRKPVCDIATSELFIYSDNYAGE